VPALTSARARCQVRQNYLEDEALTLPGSLSLFFWKGLFLFSFGFPFSLMCSTQPRRPRSLREVIQNVLTNWDQPLPLRVKLTLGLVNAFRRVQTGGCCGHPGEPGC
jgi:hypothetical protein